MPPQEKGSTPSSDSLESSLESQTQKPSTSHDETSILSRTWRHLNDNVRSSSLAEVELLILTFCIGLQDAVSFPDFHCFASNQTGNTVFLVLALILPSDGNNNSDMFVTANIGIALGFFLAAAWLTGQLGHVVGPRRRLWLVGCNFLQTCLVLAAAGVQYRAARASATGQLALDGDTTPSTLWAIGLLACAAGSQVVQSRSLRMTEISTAMATAAWVDLMVDPDFFGWRNRPRNRRLAFLGCLVLGTLAGAFIFRRVGSPAALLVSAAGKLLVTVMFLFNEAERPKIENAEDSA